METNQTPNVMKPALGRIVHFAPPSDHKAPNGPEQYPSMITQVNPDGTVELATFGPNSLYFQHGITHADTPTPGCWNWPARN
jgi:hypothetical protein